MKTGFQRVADWFGESARPRSSLPLSVRDKKGRSKRHDPDHDSEARAQFSKDVSQAWGSGDAAGQCWTAPSADQAAWVPTINPWNFPHFTAMADWLERRRRDVEEDLEAAPHLGYPVRLRQGLQRQLSRLVSLVTRDGREPYCRGFGRHWRADGQDPVASALLNGYGPDPREAFAVAMTLRGVEPCGRMIDAGARLRRFHVMGDPLGTKNGWAILHRCPPAGSFGSFANGTTHRWAADPEDLDRLATQFAQDEARAHSFFDEVRNAA